MIWLLSPIPSTGSLEEPFKSTDGEIQHLASVANLDLSDGHDPKVLAVICFLHIFSRIWAATAEDARPCGGSRVSVSSQLPIGAGLGSSAAYCVALAGGLLAHFGHIESSMLPHKRPVPSSHERQQRGL